MKSKMIIIFLCVFALVFWPSNVPNKFLTSTDLKDINELRESLLELHNKERTSRGYDALILNKKLCEYAQKHAENMAKRNRMTHSSMRDLQKVDQDFKIVGENIAWGQDTEESVVSSWMWSPMHRWNILGSSYKQIGFGVQKDKNNRNYWCVVFSN